MTAPLCVVLGCVRPATVYGSDTEPDVCAQHFDQYVAEAS